MKINFFANSMVLLHTPKFIRGAKKSNAFKKWDFRFKKITMKLANSEQAKNSHYNLEYEILDMLDYKGFPCDSDPEYNVDECMDKEIHNVSKYVFSYNLVTFTKVGHEKLIFNGFGPKNAHQKIPINFLFTFWLTFICHFQIRPKSDIALNLARFFKISNCFFELCRFQ